MRYSKDGSRLAVASKENKIDIYAIDDATAYAHAGTCVGHNSAVAHLDWDETGNWLQSVCTSYEPLFWDLTKLGAAPGRHPPQPPPHPFMPAAFWLLLLVVFVVAMVGVQGPDGGGEIEVRAK